MIVGIIGSEQAKFTPETEAEARALIVRLLSEPDVTGVSSGNCHLGGVDSYAEEIGRWLGLELHIFPPERLTWSGGYKERNMLIAAKSDYVVCITVRKLPVGYSGMRFPCCYHCGTSDHVKSGGCWTVKQARKIGKPGDVLVVG